MRLDRIVWGKCFIFLCCCTFLWVPIIAHGKIIQLTPEDSLIKINKIIGKATPGTEIHLLPGVYPGELIVSRVKGTAKNPIKIIGSTGSVIDAKKHGILIQNSIFVMIDSIEIKNAERGITIGGSQQISIINCIIHDVQNYGIMNYNSSGTTIGNNTIQRSLKEHGIYVSGEAQGIKIHDNFIEDTHINGIHCNGKILSPIIERNIFHRIGYYPDKEGGASITIVGGASSALIQNNIFFHIYGQAVTIGGPGVKIINNLFHDVSWSILLGLQGASSLSFFNNIVIEKSAIPFHILEMNLNSFTSNYNYFSLKKQNIYAYNGGTYTWGQWRKMGFDVQSIVGDIPVLDPSKGLKDMDWNYQLSRNSNAVDGGAPFFKDNKLPPGIGSERSDIGAFGGPANGWNEHAKIMEK